MYGIKDMDPKNLNHLKSILLLFCCCVFCVVMYSETAFSKETLISRPSPKTRYYQDTLRTDRVDIRGSRASNSVYIPNPRVSDINCQEFITGNHDQLLKKYPFATFFERVAKPASFFSSYASDCKNFLADRAYIMENISSEEATFPIAFGILMYKDVEQVERLLRAIYRPHNYYCIHVDSKTNNETKNAMQAIAKCFDNVFIASKYVNVVWGQFSLLEADMLCMRDLLRFRWKYYINLTGQEFPLKTNLEIVKVLKKYNGSNDVDGSIERIQKARFKGLEHKRPPGVTLYMGEMHIAVTREFINFTLNDRTAKEFLKWVKQTCVPDETFYTSLNHSPQIGVPGRENSELKNNNNISKPYMTRFKNWAFHYPCAGRLVRNICIFGLGDLQLLSSRREMFANKFHYDYQPLTYDCMEEWIFNKTRDEYLGITKCSTNSNLSSVKTAMIDSHQSSLLGNFT